MSPIKRVKKSISESRRVNKAKRWYRHLTLPGLEGVPIWKMFRQMGTEFKKDVIGMRAAAISFNFMMALSPSIIFIFSLIPVIPIDGLQENIFDFLHSILPEDAFGLVQETILDTISQKRVPLLSFVFVLMIIFATNGVNGILKTFKKINPEFKRRSFGREYMVAMMLTVILYMFLVASIAALVFSGIFTKNLIELASISAPWSEIITKGVRWTIILFIYFLGISIMFYFGPALHRKWRFISTGGVVATSLSLLASLGFASYVNNFDQYNKIYGSLGTFIVIMIWIYINAFVVLLGFEINNSIRLNKLNQMEQDKADQK